METESLTWVGLEIEDSYIERVLGEGGFSVVYLAKRRDGSELAFKVSRPQAVKIEQLTGFYNTLAQAPASTGIADIEPMPSEVLSRQYEKLNSIDCPGVVKPLGANKVGELFYYKMPVVEAPTLRTKIKDRTARLSDFQAIAKVLAQLAKQGQSHGDLKPDNILITQNGPLLIDPGYFGPLTVSGVLLRQCYITTPAYYPRYQPDDLLAFGIMMYEHVMGKNPFAIRGFSGRSDLTRCGEELIESVRDLEKVGRYEYSAILDLKFPREVNKDLPAKAEQMLLKSLRLQRTADNKLEIADGFSSFEELAAAFTPPKSS